MRRYIAMDICDAAKRGYWDIVEELLITTEYERDLDRYVRVLIANPKAYNHFHKFNSRLSVSQAIEIILNTNSHSLIRALAINNVKANSYYNAKVFMKAIGTLDPANRYMLLKIVYFQGNNPRLHNAYLVGAYEYGGKEFAKQVINVFRPNLKDRYDAYMLDLGNRIKRRISNVR